MYITKKFVACFVFIFYLPLSRFSISPYEMEMKLQFSQMICGLIKFEKLMLNAFSIELCGAFVCGAREGAIVVIFHLTLKSIDNWFSLWQAHLF